MKEKHMKPKWPTKIFEVLNKLVPMLSIYRAKMYAFLVPLRQKRRLNTLGQKQYLARFSTGGRRKLFNPGLTNKLIRIERVPFDCL